MISTNLPDIPVSPGSYALLLNLDQPGRLQVGRLGMAHLQPGLYIYLGSAWGPGGLRARVFRHLRGQGALRWQIDSLRRVARMLGVYTCSGHARAATMRLECLWSQALAAQPGAFLPVAGFGAGDCRAGCPAHLVGFKATPAFLPEVLARAAGVRLDDLQYRPACAEPGVR